MASGLSKALCQKPSVSPQAQFKLRNTPEIFTPVFEHTHQFSTITRKTTPTAKMSAFAPTNAISTESFLITGIVFTVTAAAFGAIRVGGNSRYTKSLVAGDCLGFPAA
jgi:hypothetical protein